MKIALIQMKGKNSNDDNIEIALEQIEKASASGYFEFSFLRRGG